MSDPTPRPKPELAAELVTEKPQRKPRRALITGFPVTLDACVLVNSTVRDFVLWAADLALYRPIWSEDIMREVRTTMLSFGISPERVDYTIGQMMAAFPEAMVDGYEAIVPVMTNDEGDRHVLAAAVIGKAQLIVTNNERHFPSDALAPYNIESSDPDNFLRDLLDIDRERMLEVLTNISERRKMPPKTIDDLLGALEANGCPGFAADLRAALSQEYGDK